MLVIRTGRNVVAVVGRDSSAVVAEGVQSGEADGGAGGTVAFHAKMHNAGGGGNQVQGINLITGAQVAHHHGRFQGGLRVGRGGKAAVLDAFHVHLGLVIGTIHGIDVQVHGEFTLLQAAIQAAATAAGGSHAPDRAIEAIGHGSAAGCLTVGGNVEYAAYAFRVIPNTGIGDHLNVLDGAGRHHLKDGGGILTHHLVGFAVHVHLEATAAVHGNVVLSVHRNHGNFPEHIQHGGSLGIHIVLYIIGHLVHFHLHKGPHGCDRTGF